MLEPLKAGTAFGALLAGVGLILALGAGSASDATAGRMLPVTARASLPTTVSGRYVVAGYVNATARVGRTVYIGGEFSRIANRTGSAVVVPARGGPIEPVRAEIAGGSVNTAVADGVGGWYVGGSFTTVGDTSRQGLAHLRADGTLDRIFAPPALGEVKALALAGRILVVAAAEPKAVAMTHAFDATTGGVLPLTYARPRRAGAARVLLASGDRLYVGFGNRRLAAYAIASGTRLWDRHFCESCNQDRGGVIALTLDHEKLIVGGGFKQGRNENLAVLDAGSGALTGHPLRIPRGVQSIAAVSGTLYVAYARSRPGSSGLAAVNLATGRTRSWGAIRPDLLAADATTVYMAGVSVKDERASFPLDRVYSARAGTAHAVLRRVSPPFAGDARTLVSHGGRLFVGGGFTGVGGAVRHNLAAFDGRTGALLAWRPNASDAGCCGVSALVAAGRTIYVGGPFKRVSGAPRSGLAALSADGAGRVLPWHLRLAHWDIHALAVGAGRVFVGGFLVLPGTTRDTHIAAFSLHGTGAHLPFSPKLGFEFDVGVMTVWHRTLVIGGQSVIAYAAGGDGRHELWRHSTDSYVFAFAKRGAMLYAGGNFGRVGRRPRQNLAAFALNRHGALLEFAPAVPISVEALEMFGSDIVFGGEDADGDSPQVLGAVGADGTLEPWRFDVPPGTLVGIPMGIATIGRGLFVAGDFDWLGPPGNQAAGNLAWLR